MKLSDGFTVFDLETTGVDTATDEIVQIGFAQFVPGEKVIRTKGLVRPSKPIPAEATKIHGITNEHVANAPSFQQRMKGLRPYFDGSRLVVGYNARRFDVPMLNAHLARAGADWCVGTPFDVIDVVRWWHRDVRGRTQLEVGERLYGIKPLGGTGHDAAVDAHLTGNLLLAMIEHGRLPDDLAQACTLVAKWGAQIDEEFDRWSYWLYRDRHDGETIRFGCGKHIGTPLAATDLGYLQWMLDKGHVTVPAVADLFREQIEMRDHVRDDVGPAPDRWKDT